MRKLGPPPPGTSRRLTGAEASVIGCSPRWRITTRDETIILLKPCSEPWVRLSPTGVLQTVWSHAVEMSEASSARMNAQLRRFWGERVTYRIDEEQMRRICAAARAALRGRIDRRELEWVASLDE